MPSSSAVAPPGTRLGPRANLDAGERTLSAFAGAALGFVAAKRGGVSGAVLGSVAAALALRGATGAAPVRRLVGPGPDDKAAMRQTGWSSAAVVGRAVAINRPRHEVFAYFRDFAKLPTFMENIAEVTETDATHSHWTVHGPAGTKVSWDAVITDQRDGELIQWETLPGAVVANRGRVTFKDAPGGRGTELHAEIVYRPPGGTAGKLIAKLLQREPGIQVRRDLKRLKMLLEAGEISTNAPQGAAPKS